MERFPYSEQCISRHNRDAQQQMDQLFLGPTLVSRNAGQVDQSKRQGPRRVEGRIYRAIPVIVFIRTHRHPDLWFYIRVPSANQTSANDS